MARKPSAKTITKNCRALLATEGVEAATSTLLAVLKGAPATDARIRAALRVLELFKTAEPPAPAESSKTLEISLGVNDAPAPAGDAATENNHREQGPAEDPERGA
jgi:hypothetical protein